MHEGDRRSYGVVYKVTCKLCLSVCVGNTKNNPKKEWNNISKMWRKIYSGIKILILLRLISLNISTQNRPHNSAMK